MFKEWDWLDTWQVLGLALVVTAAAIFGVYAVEPENVDYYYVSTGSNPVKPGYCSYAHWTWHTDEVAYCSDDKDKVLDFVVKANASVPHK